MTDESGASHWETDTLARREQNWRRWLEGGSAVTVAETVAETAGEESGSGQALLEAALPAGTPAQLWVAEQNPRARRFYARNGFAPDGVQVRDAVLDLEELRLVR